MRRHVWEATGTLSQTFMQLLSVVLGKHGNLRRCRSLTAVNAATELRPVGLLFNFGDALYFVSATNTPVQSAGGALSRNPSMRVRYNSAAERIHVWLASWKTSVTIRRN